MRYPKLGVIIGVLGFCLPKIVHASFIETTMGTAVVNDATAAYYNPAALVLLKNPQIIPMATGMVFRTRFTGEVTTISTHSTTVGSSSATSDYYSPSLYMGLPLNNHVILGFAAVSNFANRNPEENSILRSIQSSNTIQDYDFVPSIGVKFNENFSLGAGVNFSFTNFNLQPILGFPGSNNPDSQGTNQSNGSGIGGNIGFLYRPRFGTLIGFDYRSVTTYHENGTSTVSGSSSLSTNHYHFQFRTPARSILSISHRVTSKFGFISTLQRIQWNIIQNINLYNMTTLSGSIPIITNASIPYHLRNTWVFTLGGNYQFNPQWVGRIAATYNQSPSNGHYQVSTGNSYIVGGSVGYEMNKTFTLDGAYAHAFIQDQNISIQGNRFIVSGDNSASRDVVSLKLTVNV